MHVNRLSALLVAALSLPLLAGCSGSNAASGIELLEQPATEADALSARFDTTPLQPDSVRFAAKSGGISYYVALPADDENAPEEAQVKPAFCLVVMEREQTACGGGTPVTTTFQGGSAMLVSDGTDTSPFTADGWTRIHENVLVIGLDEAT
ncbi:hypothetical protein JTF08_14075 [Micrococcaceae bacterium RIT802]|nr:hypothetical protein [Micrococcaceae bacterium RIT 802]